MGSRRGGRKTKGDNKMIKEKYIQLLLSHQIRGITAIGDTHKLWPIKIACFPDKKTY
jgi:hypothetical protein